MIARVERCVLAWAERCVSTRAERDSQATTDVERIRIGLYHRHLPCLDRAGPVAFDGERKTAMLSGTVPESAVAEAGTTLELE